MDSRQMFPPFSKADAERQETEWASRWLSQDHQATSLENSSPSRCLVTSYVYAQIALLPVTASEHPNYLALGSALRLREGLHATAHWCSRAIARLLLMGAKCPC